MTLNPLWRLRLCALGFLLCLSSVAPTEAKAEPATGLPADVADLCSGQTAFALDLYAQLRTQKGNLFFSPYSISTALAMTWTGAAGETAKEMSAALHLPAAPAAACGSLQKRLVGPGVKRKYQLYVANALWGQKGERFKEPFVRTVNDSFGGGLNEVDFLRATEDARKTINDWVAKETRDRIKDLIGPRALSPVTKLVLTNAIYFKAAWRDQFEKDLTRKAPFYVNGTAKVETDTMHQTKRFRFAEADGVKLLELPYEGNELSMLIVLPDKRDGLAEAEALLSAAKLSEWTGKLAACMVRVALPKFKTTCPFELGEELRALGMKLAFTDAADFTGMTDSKPLFIGAVIHKAFVDVNEEGTEAAAATAVLMHGGGAPAKPLEFIADHPFLFLIRENATGCVLFMGRVVDPTK